MNSHPALFISLSLSVSWVHDYLYFSELSNHLPTGVSGGFGQTLPYKSVKNLYFGITIASLYVLILPLNNSYKPYVEINIGSTLEKHPWNSTYIETYKKSILVKSAKDFLPYRFYYWLNGRSHRFLTLNTACTRLVQPTSSLWHIGHLDFPFWHT